MFLEHTRNPDLKQRNIEKIVTIGSAFCPSVQIGEYGVNVGSLQTLDGANLNDCDLIFNIRAIGGKITLTTDTEIAPKSYDHMHTKIAQFSYEHVDIGNKILLLRRSTNTYRCEGSGFGIAMAYLGANMLETIASKSVGYNSIYAVSEDTAHHGAKDGKDKYGWTGNILVSLGYTDDHKALDSLGLYFHTRKMFVKRLI